MMVELNNQINFDENIQCNLVLPKKLLSDKSIKELADILNKNNINIEDVGDFADFLLTIAKHSIKME